MGQGLSCCHPFKPEAFIRKRKFVIFGLAASRGSEVKEKLFAAGPDLILCLISHSG